MLRRRPEAGFTLIELLVAISLMALMSVLAWRGLDGMTRAQAQLRQQADDVLALQAALAQWTADLDALALQPNASSLEWDGRALRLLRRDASGAADGLRVVAWARRGTSRDGIWLRWQSPPVSSHGALQTAWQAAALWAQNPSTEDQKREVTLVPLADWQIFFYRGDAWTNPLSSVGGANDDKANAAGLPDGVRLVLALPAGQTIGGSVTRDWVRPGLGGGK